MIPFSDYVLLACAGVNGEGERGARTREKKWGKVYYNFQWK